MHSCCTFERNYRDCTIADVHPLSVSEEHFRLELQLLSRGFSFRHGSGEGDRWKREKEGEEAGKRALLIKLQA